MFGTEQYDNLPKTEGARQVLESAYDMAKRIGESELRLEHLIWALAECDEVILKMLIEEFRINADFLAAAWNNPIARLAHQYPEPESGVTPKVSEQVDRLIERVSLGTPGPYTHTRGEFGVDDLLVGVVGGPGLSIGSDYIRSLNLDYVRVRQRIIRLSQLRQDAAETVAAA